MPLIGSGHAVLLRLQHLRLLYQVWTEKDCPLLLNDGVRSLLDRLAA